MLTTYSRDASGVRNEQAPHITWFNHLAAADRLGVGVRFRSSGR